jgi:tetratricopeptide (TPR) repeat protein
MRTPANWFAVLACACAAHATAAHALAAQQPGALPIAAQPTAAQTLPQGAAQPLGAQPIDSRTQSANSPSSITASSSYAQRGEVHSAVAELEQLRADIAAGKPGALQRLLALTEAPLGDARARDERLEQLRGSLAQLEAGVGSAADAAPGARTQLSSSSASAAHEATRSAPPTPGAGAQPLAAPAPAHAYAPALAPAAGPGSTPSALESAASGNALEGPGYCADRVRQGRAYYKAGLYERALSALDPLRDEPQALQWRARCYERLGRNAEAIDAYERLIAHPQAGPSADLARADLDFLRWRARYSAPTQALGSGAPTRTGATR